MRVGQLRDVGAGGLAQLGHRVDERDLGGEEGVGRRLDQLGGGEVGDQEGRALGDRTGVDLAQQLLGALRRGADDEPVGAQGVLDREALAEELRVPGELDALAGGSELDDALLQPGGGADRHGGLADDEGRLGEVRGQAVDDRVDVAQVGGVLALALRGADAEEVHVGVGHVGVRRGEPQAAAVEALLQQRLEVRLVERDPAVAEQLDLLGVHVHADDVEAELGHAGGVGGAEVAGAENADAEGHDGQATECPVPDRPRARRTLGS